MFNLGMVKESSEELDRYRQFYRDEFHDRKSREWALQQATLISGGRFETKDVLNAASEILVWMRETRLPLSDAQ
jgi:hypothetical protein